MQSKRQSAPSFSVRRILWVLLTLLGCTASMFATARWAAIRMFRSSGELVHVDSAQAVGQLLLLKQSLRLAEQVAKNQDVHQQTELLEFLRLVQSYWVMFHTAPIRSSELEALNRPDLSQEQRRELARIVNSCAIYHEVQIGYVLNCDGATREQSALPNKSSTQPNRLVNNFYVSSGHVFLFATETNLEKGIVSPPVPRSTSH